MKGSLIIVGFFILGIISGLSGVVPGSIVEGNLTFYALCALLLFVGIPIPGTGAWTGTLAASFLDAGFKSTVVAVCLGVIMAGIIMGLASTGVFAIIGL